MTSSERFLDAARRGDTAALREGVAWKDHDRPDDRGMTPAMWAAASGHVESLRVLAERGASVNRCDYLGRSPLHHAAGNGHVGCVVFLVAFGANIWALDNNFNTPLDAAASHNRMTVVRRLERAAADQMSNSIKTVKKQRETAIRDAEKRARRFQKFQHQMEVDARTRFDSDRGAFRGHSDPDGRPGTSPSYVSLTLSSSLSGRSALSELRPPYSTANGTRIPYSTYFEVGGAKLAGNSAHQSNGGVSNDGGSKNGSLLSALARKLQRKPRYLSTFASEPALNGGSDLDSPITRKNNGYTTSAKSTSRLYTHVDVKGEVSKPKHQQPRPSTPFHASQSAAEIVVHQDDGSLEMEEFDGSPTDQQFWIQRNAARGHTAVQVSDDPSTRSRDPEHLEPASKSVDRTSDPEGSPSVVVATADHHQNSGTIYESNNTKPARFPERNGGSGLETFLQSYGLLEYMTVLAREKLDMNSLALVNDLDLKELGIPLGPRRILLDAVTRRRRTLSSPGGASDARFRDEISTTTPRLHSQQGYLFSKKF